MRRYAAPLTLVLGLVAAYAAYALWGRFAGEEFAVAAVDPEDVARFIRAWGPWAAFGSILLMVLHSFVPLPSEIIALGNGMIFGPWLGVLLTWSGAMLGAVVAFALARWLGRPFARWALPDRHWRRIDAFPARPSTLLLARLVPVISFNLVNYAAGLLGVRWWPFLWTTALGILPLTIGTVLLGHEMMRAPWWGWALATVLILGSWVAWQRIRMQKRG